MRFTELCVNHSLGDERVAARQAFSLASIGHEVLVLGRGDPGKVLPEHDKLDLVSLYPLIRGSSIGARVLRLKALARAYSLAIVSRPDILVAHEPDTALLALWLRRKTRAPVHFDVHECFDEVVAARVWRPVSGLAKWLVGRVVAAVVRQCDWVTVVSPVLAGQLATARFDGRITVIYNSPPIEGFPHADQSRVPPLVVCHEGWLDNSRGMSQLLHSVAIARRRAEVRLLVVGKVRPQCQEEFAQLVAQLDLKAAVTVTGWVAYNEVGRYDAQAQVGLVTMQPSGNNYNGLSNKLFSYMACGQAVIVPAGSASEELATRFGAGIAVDATDPASIADAIVRLHDDHDLRRELGRRGRAAIESELGWGQMRQRLQEIYTRLAAEGRGASAP